jgi:hypothetical protein
VNWLLISQGTSSQLRKCVVARGVTADPEVPEKLVYRHLTAHQTTTSDSIQALLSSLQKRNLVVSKLVDIAADYDPCITGFQSSMCLLLQTYVRLSSQE